MCVCARVSVYVCARACVYVRAYVRAHVCACTWVFMCVCVCARVRVRVCFPKCVILIKKTNILSSVIFKSSPLTLIMVDPSCWEARLSISLNVCWSPADNFTTAKMSQRNWYDFPKGFNLRSKTSQVNRNGNYTYYGKCGEVRTKKYYVYAHQTVTIAVYLVQFDHLIYLSVVVVSYGSPTGSMPKLATHSYYKHFQIITRTRD